MARELTSPVASCGHWAPLQIEDPAACLTEAPPSALPSEADLARAAHEVTRLAVAYLQENYAAEQLSRRQLASHIAVCERYLTYIFRRDLGITPWEYLTRFRIEQAKRLLHATDLTATEIAGRVGYNDGAYFCRVFHRETGYSPCLFRRQGQQPGGR